MGEGLRPLPTLTQNISKANDSSCNYISAAKYLTWTS